MREFPTPNPLNKFSSGNVEQWPKRFADLSDAEKLGLDSARFELVMNDQAESFGKAVAWLYDFDHANNDGMGKTLHRIRPERLDEIFNYFGLNLDEYDANNNPGGMIGRSLKGDEERIYKTRMALKMLSIDEIYGKEFFLNYRKVISSSPTFKERVKRQDNERALFPLTHAEEYPSIHKLLSMLETQYGLRPVEIFAEDKIPPIKSNPRAPHTLEQYLQYLTHILSGAYTKSELFEKHETHGIRWDHARAHLSDKARTLTEEGVKKFHKLS